MKKTVKKVLSLLLVGCLVAGAAAGCGQSKKQAQQVNQEPIKIGCKTMSEQMILQEVLAQLIEAKTDYTVERMDPTAGGTNNIMPAMEAGEMDLYPEYTGTGWKMVLKNTDNLSGDEMFEALNKAYNEKYNMSWVAMYGFENTYTYAVKAETAEQYNLVTMTDLRTAAPELVFGGNFDYFERADGYQAVCDEYDLHFKGTAEVDMGLKYQTLMEGKCDVMNAYTTDSQIAEYNLVALQDDHHFFPDYHCATVVRNEVLEAYPGLQEVLEEMNGLISNEDMVKMNYELNTNHKLEADIAKAFLQEKGIVK